MKNLNILNIIFFASLLSANISFGQCYSAVSLDGTNDYLHTPFSNYSFNNFTLEMVINSADYNPNEHYISLYQNAYIVLGGWSSGGVFDTWADGLNPISTSSTPANTPATGTWHHVAFVYDGNNQLLYIDGTLVNSSPTSGAVNITTGFNSGLVIGARYDQNQQYSNTSFEDVRIWTIARSAAEISANINTNLSGNETGLVAYYRFEDGQGSSTVADLSGNGNTLTMYNMDPTTDWIVGPFGSTSYTDNQSACDSYTWSANGQSYTQSGQYTEVLSDQNGCDSTVTLDLTITNSSAGSETVTVCNAYTWSANGQTYTQSGQYTEVLTNVNGCDSTLTLNLTIETIGITTQPADQTVFSGNNAQFSVVSSALNPTFQWQMNEGTGWLDLFNAGQFSGVDTDILTVSNVTLGQNNNLFRCILTENSNCSDTTDVAVLTIEDNTGIEEVNQQISIYPNPTSASFTISSESSINSSFKLFDIQGKVVLKGRIESTEETVDISKLSKGQYNLVFEDESISPISIIKN